MNWSKEWGNKPDEPKSEAQKVHDDAVMYGIGFIKDGKHVPREDVFVGSESIYETRKIKLGNKTIPVIVVGDLGLDFCEPGEKDEGWNIYHLPTLAGFSSVVPLAELIYEGDDVNGEYCYDKPELLRWMARVQENYPTSWQVLRLLTPDTYLDNGTTAKEIIQKWCLSVKVE